MNIFWTDEFKCHGRIWSEKHDHAPVLLASMVWRPNNKVCKITLWLSSPAHIEHNSDFYATFIQFSVANTLFWENWSYFHRFDYCSIQATPLLAKFTLMIFVLNSIYVWITTLTLYVCNDRLSFSLYYWPTLLTRRCLPIWMMMSVYLIKL